MQRQKRIHHRDAEAQRKAGNSITHNMKARMAMKIWWKPGLTIAAAVLTVVSGLLRAEEGPVVTVERYLQAVKAGEWAAAEGFWAPEDLEHSRRMGISYREVPLKIDSASPLLNGIEGIRSGTYAVSVETVTAEGGRAEVRVVISRGSDSADYVYHLAEYGEEWKLVSPLRNHATICHISSTEFVNVYYTDSSKVNMYAMKHMNLYLQRLLFRFGLTVKEMDHLNEVKLDYYVCSEDEMEQLSGYKAQGMTNLQFDAVISRQLPHHHELVHFMINFALGELPLYTLPFMQEGTAVSNGGRWGKSREVILQLGEFVLRSGYFGVEDILTWDGFQAIGNADFSYPIAGLLAEYLGGKLSGEDYRKLYLKFSGSAAEVRGMDIEFVEGEICSALEVEWDDFLRDFGEFYPQFKYSGILPWGEDSYDGEILYRDEAKMYTVRDGGRYYALEIDMSSRERVTIIFNDPFLRFGDEYESWMFAEQFSGEEYSGQTHGLVITKDEAGCYGYGLNVLLAKYAVGFQGNEGYIDDAGVVRFRLEKDLLGGAKPDIR